ncbi:hypothetical protein OsI_03010 [Oryza sativa Indica Group]|uniref:Uncharacterized protein n=1 Tax=Oryza sativa subsp. indica TaxID=39946 RepID=A2WT19_ORYSI|nr:hypothetical protein OsI_03010 [Oryza sativa Indica Group]
MAIIGVTTMDFLVPRHRRQDREQRAPQHPHPIGHELPDGSVVWGKSSSFRVLPSAGQASLQRIVVFGDMG